MSKDKIIEAEEVKSAKLDNTIDPEMIVMDDDSDMPEPETKSYEKLIKCTNKFMQLFHETVDTLPYATILKNSIMIRLSLLIWLNILNRNMIECLLKKWIRLFHLLQILTSNMQDLLWKLLKIKINKVSFGNQLIN